VIGDGRYVGGMAMKSMNMLVAMNYRLDRHP